MRRLIGQLRGSLTRGIVLTTLLGALLIAAQQGFLAHQLGHVAVELAHGADSGNSDVPAKPCEQCLAFAPIGGAVAAAVALLPAVSVSAVVVAVVAATFLIVDLPSARSRGPPFVR